MPPALSGVPPKPEKTSAVAVAVLDFQGLEGADESFLTTVKENFVTDMGALKRVRHPNVVAVHEVGETDEKQAFAAMELLEGDSLDEWLEGNITRDQALRLFSSVLMGLAAVHRAGVVHGDIEPGNIIVNKRGAPKLLGFGLNRASSRVAGSPWNQSSGVNISVAYAAPEQARGELDAFSDVYSVGLILRQALCGGPPDQTSHEGLPKPLVDALNGALAEDPQERFTTEEFRRALGKAALVLRGSPNVPLPLRPELSSTETTLPGRTAAPTQSLDTEERPLDVVDEEAAQAPATKEASEDSEEAAATPAEDDAADEDAADGDAADEDAADDEEPPTIERELDADQVARPSEPAPPGEARSKFTPPRPAELHPEADDGEENSEPAALSGAEPTNAPPKLPSSRPPTDAAREPESEEEEVERVSLTDALVEVVVVARRLRQFHPHRRHRN